MKKEREVLEFQVHRSVTNLYKVFLQMVEELSLEHDDQFKKLKNALPEEEKLLTQAQYLDEGRLNFIRKKILDCGNDTRRELLLYMNNFDINFKKE